MSSQYTKVCYDSDPTHRLHHTKGVADDSAGMQQFHYDTDLIIDYFKKGCGDIRIEGKLYKFRAGDLIILNPSELHLCSIQRDVEYERITLHTNEAILDSFHCDRQEFFRAFYDREPGTGNLIPAQVVKKQGIDGMLDCILRHAKSGTAVGNVLLRCKVIELLSQLCEAARPYRLPERTPDSENPLINEILHYINNHYCEAISLADIAARFYHSKYHISHLFKEYIGISLNDYIIIRRIYLVNNLLRNKYAVAEACYKAGFHNYSNFFRLYKKHMNMTPQQFRMQAFEREGAVRKE